MNDTKKGLIALDIDGTITSDMKPISQNVIDYFTKLYRQGWTFIFITGRTFDFGYRVLKELPFEYYYASQNGAILFEMPQKKILVKKYLDRSILSAMEKICENEPTDFVIYAGAEYNNQCFYRPKHFSEQLLTYLKKRCEAYGETWTPLSSFDLLPIHEFASIKCFATENLAQRLGKKIDQLLGLHVPVIKDPFSSEFYVVQATHPDVTKGRALYDLVHQLGYNTPVIAAGDDLNDLTMFEAADICIAMRDAPEELKNHADIIAPSASEEGIILGLEKALDSFSS